MRTFDEKNHIYSSISHYFVSCIEHGAAWLYSTEREDTQEYWFKRYLQDISNLAYKNFGIKPQKEVNND